MSANSNVYGVSVRNVGSYQVAGTPFVTGSTSALGNGSETKIEFPTVTKSFMIHFDSSGAPTNTLDIHFVPVATAPNVISNDHYIRILSGDSFTFNVKCKEVYITSNGTGNRFQLVAELTNIPSRAMFALTGSGISD